MSEVHCAHDAMVPIAELRSHPKNPNKHPEEQIRLLAKVIEHHGWRAPITVSTRSGFIVRGHGRLMAAQKLGVTEVPVDYQDYASEEDELADLVADNRISELSDPDKGLLKDVLAELDTGAFDLEMAGFSWDQIQKLLDTEGAQVQTLLDQGIQLVPRREYVVVMCADDDEWEALKTALELPLVRRGGYKPGSPYERVSTQRVIHAGDLLGRLGHADSDTE